MFAKALLQTGVLLVDGEIDTHEQFTYIRLFTSAMRSGDRAFKVLMATTATNTSIDQLLCLYVLGMGFP